MALLTSEYEERLRLLDIANGYGDDAVRVEALQGPRRQITRNALLDKEHGGEGGFEPTVRLPVQRFSSSMILVLTCRAQ
jgi:hypothetical protein